MPAVCSVPDCIVVTSRSDGLCESCASRRREIETSLAQGVLTKIVLACEQDWRFNDRLDFESRRR